MGYQLIVLGASYGGTNALRTILPALPQDFPAPIVIVQHTGPDAGNYMATHFDSICQVAVKEAEEKEQIRLANLNNTGVWSVNYYVDEFGERTKQGYITNSLSIKGAFSNTATQDSRLNVDFLIFFRTAITLFVRLTSRKILLLKLQKLFAI